MARNGLGAGHTTINKVDKSRSWRSQSKMAGVRGRQTIDKKMIIKTIEYVRWRRGGRWKTASSSSHVRGLLG